MSCYNTGGAGEAGFSNRQVHLDFHTSGHIQDIGAGFDRNEFQQALKEGNVNSITVFAKCHHSYCYYPTRVGAMHPGLHFDLLGEMIDAAHEIGVKAPIYITAGWSALDAEQHPEWRSKTADGQDSVESFDAQAGPEVKKPEYSWRNLCLNDGTYARHIYDLTREICERYEVDGLFYDICFYEKACWCAQCREGMVAEGLDPACEEDAMRYYREKHLRFMEACRAIVREFNPAATVFFNGGAETGNPEYHPLQTHFELEDLPTTWGGYDKLPLRARYFTRLGKPYLGMTGKFHMAWGEFGGFKTPEALRYEVAAMMALGAGCSIGDQLHPSGKMDPDTYRLIGDAYEYARQIEPYCFGTQPVTGLGLYLSQSQEANEGVAKALLDGHLDFDIVHNNSFSAFKAVVIPEGAVLGETAQENLRAYLQRGGGLLLFGDSIVQQGAPLTDIVEGIMPGEFDQDYLRITSPALPVGLSSPFLMYTAAPRVEAAEGCESLAEIVPPYFNRSYGRYCGHKNAPYDPAATRYSGAIKKGSTVYAAHPVGSLYKQYGSAYYRRYLTGLLRLVLPQPALEIDLPSAGRAFLNKQPAARRYCLHVLYAPPLNRGAVEVIEDVPVLRDIAVRLRLPEKLRSATLQPDGMPLQFQQEQGITTLQIPQLCLHTLLVLEY